MSMGIEVDHVQGLKLKILSGTFASNEALTLLCIQFAKTFAPKCKDRLVFKEIKKRLHASAILCCETKFMSPQDMALFMKPVVLPSFSRGYYRENLIKQLEYKPIKATEPQKTEKLPNAKL
jgi:hypothetical protein